MSCLPAARPLSVPPTLWAAAGDGPAPEEPSQNSQPAAANASTSNRGQRTARAMRRSKHSEKEHIAKTRA